MKHVMRFRRGRSKFDVFRREGVSLRYLGYCNGELVVAAPYDHVTVGALIRYGTKIGANSAVTC